MFLFVIFLKSEFLLLIKCLQNLRRIGLRNRNGIESLAFEVDDETIGFVMEHTYFLDVDDIGSVAAHQTAGIHAIICDGLHFAAEHITCDGAAALVKHIDIVILSLDVIQIVELDGQLQIAVIVHQVDDLGVFGHYLVVRLHRVALGEHKALSRVFQQDGQYGDGVRHRQSDKGDENAFGIEIAETMVGGSDFEVGNQRVAHRDDHDFEE